MASLPIAFGATAISAKRRTFTAAATKGTTKGSTKGPTSPPEEKSLLDFVIGAIMKEDQVLVETDPLLNKVEGKVAPAGGTRGKSTVSVPAIQNKSGCAQCNLHRFILIPMMKLEVLERDSSS